MVRCQLNDQEQETRMSCFGSVKALEEFFWVEYEFFNVIIAFSNAKSCYVRVFKLPGNLQFNSTEWGLCGLFKKKYFSITTRVQRIFDICGQPLSFPWKQNGTNWRENGICKGSAPNNNVSSKAASTQIALQPTSQPVGKKRVELKGRAGSISS